MFNEFVNEFQLYENLSKTPSLKKVYLATRRSSGQKWLTYKGFAGSKFFVQITEDNIDKIDINPDYPILNYHSSIIEELLSKNKIKEGNIYNHPKWIHLSGSKEEFHKLVGDDENIPTTVYTKDDAIKKLKFPIIAKPSNGHSGIGIQVIKNSDELKNLDESSFDTFSEYIDKVEEMRVINFKGNPIFWMQREPLNSKAKNGDGDTDEEMQFRYIKRNPKEIPSNYKNVLKKYCDIYKNLPYICFDMMKDKNGKVFVIESNAQPGVPFDSTVEIYKNIYKDFYNEEIDDESMKVLNKYSDEMINKTLKKDPNRFLVK